MPIDVRELLERGAPAPLCDVDIDAVSARGRQWRRRRTATTAAAVVAVVALAVLPLPRLLSPTPDVVFDDPIDALVGTWVSTDGDGSNQTMNISAVDGGYDIVVTDDSASVCSGAPSTGTGTGQVEEARLVISDATLTCDDGSTPVPVDGSALEDVLRDYTLTPDAATATLTDNFGIRWHRPSATPDDVIPEADPPSLPWPQSSLAEAREAQERADAGDPDYTWQVDDGLNGGKSPSEAAIYARFLTEELGWGGFRCCQGSTHGGSMHWPTTDEADFVRCAAGAINPLYPDDPNGRSCAPTLADGGYERVRVTASQPVESIPGGIWTIQRSVPQSPFYQMVPPSDAEIAAQVEPFLQARVDGEGAEQHVDSDPAEIPLLYAASNGAPYERFEHEVLEGPLWPYGIVVLNVRLFADGGQTVVEQQFELEAGFLDYRSSQPTTENDAPIPELYNLLDGRVSFAADQSWQPGVFGPGFFFRSAPDIKGYYRNNQHDQQFVVVADPLTPTATCPVGDEPLSAEALIRSLRSRPNLSVSAPRTTRIGSIDAVELDVTAGDQGGGCIVPSAYAVDHSENGPAVLAPPSDANHPELWWGVGRSNRARLYVFDVPGDPARTVAILVMAPKPDFQAVLEATQPIIDSFALDGE